MDCGGDGGRRTDVPQERRVAARDPGATDGKQRQEQQKEVLGHAGGGEARCALERNSRHEDSPAPEAVANERSDRERDDAQQRVAPDDQAADGRAVAALLEETGQERAGEAASHRPEESVDSD